MVAYCALCSSELDDGDGEVDICRACWAVIGPEGKLHRAYEMFQVLHDNYSKCCAGMDAERTELYFHTEEWSGSYENVHVEVAISLQEQGGHMQWLFDNTATVDANDFGDVIPYGDDPVAFMASIDVQLDEGPKAAWHAGIQTCAECGYHIHNEEAIGDLCPTCDAQLKGVKS